MKVAYLSITGNVKQFIKKLGLNDEDIIEVGENIYPESIEEDFVLIAPTYEEDMTFPLNEFLDENKACCKGIIGSGNRNFGDDGYCFTAKDLSKEYNIPVIYDFEYAGLDSDVLKVKELLNK